jgi:Signal transduction histidine kinase
MRLLHRPRIALSAIFVLVAAVLCAAPQTRAPLARDGMLDLGSWDFTRDGAVSLGGDWEFFPGELLNGPDAVYAPRLGFRQVPDSWGPEISAGTYRLTVILPHARPELGIRYTTVSTAFELDADGALVANAGRPALYTKSMASAYRPGVAAIAPAADRVVLVVRVSNDAYRVGGMWRAFTLGPRAALERGRWVAETQSLALACALAVLSVIFAFFIRTKGSGSGFAAFAAFTLVAALRAIVTGEYAIVDLVPGIGFESVIRLEYFSAFASYPLALLFFYVLFPTELDKRVALVALAFSGAFLLLLPFAPLSLLTRSLVPYYGVAIGIMALVSLILARAIVRRRAESVPLLLGGLALFSTAANDMLFSNFLVQSANLFPYGMLLFIGAQAFALSLRYRSVQAQLGAALAEKDLLLQEVHHRVRNSLQIMSSIISLQSHRSSEPAALAAYASMRDRIRAMSLVHEKLYSLDTGDNVDVASYLRELAVQLSASYDTSGKALSVEAEKLSIPSDLCIDIGLIVTELVANAYRHAIGLAGGTKVLVRIVRRSDILVLSVSDDGPGFPEGFDVEKPSGLGFRLVASLVKKRKAKLSLSEGRRATVEILFPLA